MLALGRLDPAAMADMTRACLDAADLPAAVHEFVAGRAEGIPFLVEEVLAGLVGEGALTERDGRWHAADLSAPGVPATFADAVRRRLDGMSAESRQVIGAAAVLGRRFDWTLLGPVTGLADAGRGRGAARGHRPAAGRGGAGRFPVPARAHPRGGAGRAAAAGADHAGRTGAGGGGGGPSGPAGRVVHAGRRPGRAGRRRGRAGALLLEAGRRDLAAGALASAEHTLTQARDLVGPALRTSVDEALTEVFAMSGQVDRAIETGRMLLARLGPPSPRAAHLHLGIARAAIAGARWAEAAASIEVARESAGADTAQIDACAAQVAAGRGRLEEADRLARAALRAAEGSHEGQRVQPEVACEALEVIGRVARQRDLEAAERAFARAADLAGAHGLRLWRLRALHELGTIDQLRTESVDRLEQARELAVAQGALALTATLDLQIAAGLNKQFRADEALAAARRSADASRRFHLATLPMALIFQATAHAIRGEEGPMEDRIAEAVALAPGDQDVTRLRLGALPGHVLPAGRRPRRGARADDDRGRAAAEFAGDDRAAVPRALAAARRTARPGRGRAPRPGSGPPTAPGTWWSRPCSATPTRSRPAARAGRPMPRRRSPPPTGRWGRWWPGTGSTRARLAAEAALADGWGEPVAWLREAAAYFAARGDDRVAAACRALLRRAGAPVPRPAGDGDLPGPLRALGVTEREADVLRLVAQGLGNREIAERMFLSPRTVEKHVASLLAKTGLRRGQLAGYSAGLDG